jgi:hypothetical protein
MHDMTIWLEYAELGKNYVKYAWTLTCRKFAVPSSCQGGPATLQKQSQNGTLLSETKSLHRLA